MSSLRALSLVTLLHACATTTTQPVARARPTPMGPTQCPTGQVLVSSSVLSGVASNEQPEVTNECMDEARYQQLPTASMYTCQRDGANATCRALPPSAGR